MTKPLLSTCSMCSISSAVTCSTQHSKLRSGPLPTGRLGQWYGGWQDGTPATGAGKLRGNHVRTPEARMWLAARRGYSHAGGRLA